MPNDENDILTEEGLDQEIDEALTPADEKLDAADMGIDDEEEDPDAGAGGGDIDDPDTGDDSAQAIDFSAQRAERLAQAKQVKDAWDADYKAKESAFEAAQAKLKAVRSDIDADEDATMAAEQAVMDARFQVNKSRDGLDTATSYYESETQRPDIAPAAQAWLAANRRYGRDTAFTAAAKKVMAKLKDEGMDETHQNYYRRLDEGLRRAPKMGRDNNSRQSAGTVTRTGRPGNRPARNAKGEEGVSRTEQKFMKRIGLDPAKPAVRAEWNNSKQQVRRMVRERRGG